jgi:rare lipoprotein A
MYTYQTFDMFDNNSKSNVQRMNKGEMSMIKQNHSNLFTAVIMLVVLMFGCNMAQARVKSHHNGCGSQAGQMIGHHHRKGSIKSKGYKATGIASYYSYESGCTTATGDHFDPLKLTAAHRTLPLPSTVKVTNIKTGTYVILIVNDRGPYKHHRLIDLSLAAARAIGLEKDGVGLVEIVVLK